MKDASKYNISHEAEYSQCLHSTYFYNTYQTEHKSRSVADIWLHLTTNCLLNVGHLLSNTCRKIRESDKKKRKVLTRL